MDVKPIRTEAGYRAALAEIETLMDVEEESADADRLDVLVTLVDAWEALHHPIEDPDPVEAIIHRMEALGLERRDLEPLIGSRGRVSEVLGRKRPLTMPMVRRLHAALNIPAETLIKPYAMADQG
jgi:HTH-type transcriptional regulator / antitoxin HigA